MIEWTGRTNQMSKKWYHRSEEHVSLTWLAKRSKSVNNAKPNEGVFLLLLFFIRRPLKRNSPETLYFSFRLWEYRCLESVSLLEEERISLLEEERRVVSLQAPVANI